jgi:hypothetical protein
MEFTAAKVPRTCSLLNRGTPFCGACPDKEGKRGISNQSALRIFMVPFIALRQPQNALWSSKNSTTEALIYRRA